MAEEEAQVEAVVVVEVEVDDGAAAAINEKRKRRESDTTTTEEEEANSSCGSSSDAPPEKKKSKKKATRKPSLLKKELAELLRTSDAAALKRRGLNAKQEPRHVLTHSKHDVVIVGGGKLRGLTTLSLAIHYVYLAGEDTTDALETLRVLVEDCGLLITSEPRSELLDFISRGGSSSSSQVEVLKMLMSNGFLKGRKSVMSATRRFIASGRTQLLCALLKKRYLDEARTFEVATMVIMDGTEAMLRSVLAVMHKRGTLTEQVPRHAVTGSTLLHFAAKYVRGRYVDVVVPYCDTKLVDHKGYTALHFLEKSVARGNIVPSERLALLA